MRSGISGGIYCKEISTRLSNVGGEFVYVILVYDVKKKRVQKVMKICRKYLNHLQNSVFEGNITEAKLTRLKGEIKNVIDVKTDSVCIFKLDSTKYVSKEQIGIITLYEHII